MPERIVIIGGGMAGMSAGCYGRMNGYDTDIFEMHTVPGGVCTGWTRKGFTFDGCLHWLAGTSPSNPFYTVWRELGALCGKKVINHEAFCHFVLPSGQRIIQYSDIDRFIDELKRIGPADAETLEQLRRDVKLFGALRQPIGAARVHNPIAALRALWKIRPYLPLFKRYGALSAERFAASLKSSCLRELFPLLTPYPEFPFLYNVSLMSMLNQREAGWPEGGSLALARSIERRYGELGGRIHYQARVTEILVENGRAVGVRLADGAIQSADYVISAADGHATLFEMLGGRYISTKLSRQYKTLPLFKPLVQVSFGVNRNLSREPRLTTCAFASPLRIGGTAVSWLYLNNYGFDPSLAPKDKAPLTILFESPYEQWEPLSGDREAYQREKRRIERDSVTWLESVYPGIAADIEVTDVATPLTTIRYTGNWHGSYEGWRPTVATMRQKIGNTLPGLRNFWMIGQWTRPLAGLPTVTLDGRNAIQNVCRQDRRQFVTC